MNAYEIEKKLIELIDETIRIEMLQGDIIKFENKENCDLMNDLGFDSLLMVKLIIDVENCFNLEFGLEDLNIEYLRKYQNLLKYIIDYLTTSSDT